MKKKFRVELLLIYLMWIFSINISLYLIMFLDDSNSISYFVAILLALSSSLMGIVVYLKTPEIFMSIDDIKSLEKRLSASIKSFRKNTDRKITNGEHDW